MGVPFKMTGLFVLLCRLTEEAGAIMNVPLISGVASLWAVCHASGPSALKIDGLYFKSFFLKLHQNLGIIATLAVSGMTLSEHAG